MRLSLQLYTLRDQLSDDLTGTLAQVQEIGYQYVETAGGSGRTDEEWRELLMSYGLVISGTHTPIEKLEDDVEGSIKSAKALGTQYVIVPWIGEDRRKNWEVFGRSLTEIGRKLSDAGLTLAYHNHDFEFQNDGLETLYTSSDPAFLKAELDLAWVQIGGGDPAEWIRKMAGRLPLVHLKDFDPAKDPLWQSAGEGIVKWDECLAACREVGVEYGAVELDSYDGDPIDAVRNSYRFFSERGIV